MGAVKLLGSKVARPVTVNRGAEERNVSHMLFPCTEVILLSVLLL